MEEDVKQKREQALPGLQWQLGWEFHALPEALHRDEDELLTTDKHTWFIIPHIYQ